MTAFLFLLQDINYGKNIKSSKRKNGIFYAVTLKLSHRFPNDVCSGEVFIQCRMGTKRMDIYRKEFNICPAEGMYCFCLQFLMHTI